MALPTCLMTVCWNTLLQKTCQTQFSKTNTSRLSSQEQGPPTTLQSQTYSCSSQLTHIQAGVIPLFLPAGGKAWCQITDRWHTFLQTFCASQALKMGVCWRM